MSLEPLLRRRRLSSRRLVPECRMGMESIENVRHLISHGLSISSAEAMLSEVGDHRFPELGLLVGSGELVKPVVLVVLVHVHLAHELELSSIRYPSPHQQSRTSSERVSEKRDLTLFDLSRRSLIM